MKSLQPSPPEAARELLFRRRARRYLLEFIRYTFAGYDANWHHALLCDYLDRFAAGDIKRLMVFAPPRHGKSEIVSRRLPAFLLGRHPGASIIVASYSADLAGQLNKDTQRIIDSPDYRTLFPDTRLARPGEDYTKTRDLFEVVGQGGVYRSAGVGGGITGHGFDFGIIDDPVKNDEEAYSPTHRQAVLDWYKGTFYTRRAPAAGILLTMTRWHRGDLAGALLQAVEEDPSADKWTVVSLDAKRSDTTPASTGDTRSPGEPLWESRYSRKNLELTQTTLGPVKWAAMYQQRPIAEGGAEWPDSFFGPQIWFDDWPRDIIVRGIGLDPSKGKDAKHGDYSAFVKVGVTRDCTVWCDADLRNDRDSTSIVETGVELCINWKPDVFAIETNQFQELFVPEFQRIGAARGIVLPIYSLVNTVKKDVRIRRLTPWLSQGRLRFKANSPGARLLVRQLQDFPQGEHDDGPDALEMVLRQLNAMGAGSERVAGRVG